jgi:DAK2 domain fusion protein YloV
VAAIDVLDPSGVRRWCAGAVAALSACRAEIDDLNVFPVPDRDTGTNLLLTLRAADDAVRSDPPGDLAVTVASMARGAVLGARGNSGVIVSQVLRGFAEGLVTAGGGRGAAVAAAIGRGAELAWESVGDPVEGTMLSVVRAAAEAAAGAGDGLADAVGAAVRGAADALERTPAQLPVLAEAGVVDAGGRGLLVLLEALAAVVAAPPAGAGTVRTVRTVRDRGRLEAVRESGSDAYGYEVQYLLTAPASAVGELREELTALGDSLVVVGTGEGRWTVHVHVNDIGAAVEAGVRAGRPHRITVTRFADAVAAAAPRREGVAVVAVAPAGGVAELFAAEGVVVVEGVPAAEEVLAAVEATGAAAVVVLPGCVEVSGVCDAAADRARAAGIEVAVIPIRAAVQGLAAVAVHDQARRFGDDVIAMAEAAAATRFAEVLVATRDGLTMAGPCRAGDVLGLVDGDVAVIGGTPLAVAGELLARMLNGGGELVTLVLGAEAAEGMARALERRVAETHPGVEVTVHTVARPDVPVLIGVE